MLNEEYILNNLHLSNRELGELTGITQDKVKWILRKKHITRNEEQLQQIHIRRGELQKGENNPLWKGGISIHNYRYNKIQRERFPDKFRARNAVYKAIKKGLLIRKPCEVCGNPNSEAHHSDYSKPLMVQFLCRDHHIIADKQIREYNRSLGPLFSRVI